MNFALDIQSRGFKEAEEMLKGVKNGFSRAMSRSINASLKAGRTESAQLVRARYNLKAPTIKAGFAVRKATASRLEGELEAKGPMLPLSEFSAKGKIRKAGRGQRTHQYVYAAIVRGKAKLIKGAFIPPGKAVLERRQPERLPFFPVMTIGVPFMVGSLKISDKVEERMRQAYDTALKGNVNFYLNQATIKSQRFKA